jgi:hypothetical protein
MPNFAGWWAAGTAANVEAWVAANSGAFPANTVLYHGTNQPFRDQVTGFDGSEQAWVTAFFQHNLGGTAHAGAGIYGADNLLTAQGYGASVMKTITSTLGRTRYIDIRNGQHAAFPAPLTQQDVLRHAYRCVLRYTLNYYAVKDHRVEWEPN